MQIIYAENVSLRLIIFSAFSILEKCTVGLIVSIRPYVLKPSVSGLESPFSKPF